MSDSGNSWKFDSYPQIVKTTYNDPGNGVIIKYTKDDDGSDLSRGSVDSAGTDVSAKESGVVLCGTTKLVGTGLRFEVPPGKFMRIVPRSGLSLKSQMSISNSPGTLDSDYRGELGLILKQGYPLEFFISVIALVGALTVGFTSIFVSVSNYELFLGYQVLIEILILAIYVVLITMVVSYYAKYYGFNYSAGDRLAQIIIEDYYRPDFVEVGGLTDTSRGEGGFGSTGVTKS